jgi:hypothetical protein
MVVEKKKKAPFAPGASSTAERCNAEDAKAQTSQEGPLPCHTCNDPSHLTNVLRGFVSLLTFALHICTLLLTFVHYTLLFLSHDMIFCF